MKKTQWLRQDNAVTEILGTMLLLLIAVAIFSTVYFSVLTISPKSPIPHANLAFTFNNENITISHLNGEPLNPKSIVIISIDNTTISQEIRNISSWDTNNDNLWGFGEKLVLQSGQTDLIDCDISLKIVDKQSNSLVFFGEYHQPSDYLPNIATEVNDISFMQSGPTLSISASGDLLLTNISLFYRYSSDNVSWTSYSKFGVDTAQPWQWIFDFPNSYGWYEFYSIGTYNSSYETPPFTADAYCAYSRAPVISDPLPTNGEINVELNKTLSINISDADGSVMDLTWYSNASGSWQQIGANNSVGNGTYYCDTAPLTSGFDTTYYWNVSVTDGTSTVESTRYHFTTLGESNPPMVPTYIYPLDKSITTLNPTLNWTCIDPEGGDLTYDVYFDTNNPPVAKLSANQSSSTFSSPAPTYG
ncbi:MAG: type IV pilin N-terminal domain-containing protein, partial [Candidatus Thermoplasmatota archaeon]|nr:type IV pilin N-terminal domain-containing protein [Candidatus Thermoplasmatota archaeon]